MGRPRTWPDDQAQTFFDAVMDYLEDPDNVLTLEGLSCHLGLFGHDRLGEYEARGGLFREAIKIGRFYITAERVGMLQSGHGNTPGLIFLLTNNDRANYRNTKYIGGDEDTPLAVQLVDFSSILEEE